MHSPPCVGGPDGAAGPAASERSGSAVTRDYDRPLRRRGDYGSEHNGGGTNSCALPAAGVEGGGGLATRGRGGGHRGVGEIPEKGRGFPRGGQRRLFEPFFTTKPL